MQNGAAMHFGTDLKKAEHGYLSWNYELQLFSSSEKFHHLLMPFIW